MNSAEIYRMQGNSLSIPPKDHEVLPPYRWYLTIRDRIGGDVDPNSELPEFGRFGIGFEEEFNDDVSVLICIDKENTTNIEKVEDGKKMIEDSVYDLQGRRKLDKLDNRKLSKGLYIVNKKKYFVK